MEFLEIVVKFFQATAWPGVIALVAMQYRQVFTDVLKRLEKAKFGDAEFSLGKKEAEEAITRSSEQLINIISEDIASQQLNQDSESIKLDNSKSVHFSVKTADIDGDGKTELVLSNPLGAYSSHVRVFKPIVDFNRGGQTKVSFELIGEIRPVNYIVDVKSADLGKKAVIIVNEDGKSNKPHVVAPRDEVTYKWIEGGFHEISRRRVREAQDV